MRPYGRLPDGRAAFEFTPDNGHGLVLRAINLVALELTLASDDGDEHYPGRLDVTVRAHRCGDAAVAQIHQYLAATGASA
ncbi:MAG TPA: hypothetical protein VNU71_04405 [Burkholderiaceae bacterium]|nr:hypothetical protein [Burkholderiaceae bacterium]